MSLFSAMGLPAPQNLTPEKTKFSDDDIVDLANKAMHGGPALTTAQKARLDAIRRRQGFAPVNVPVDDTPAAAGGAGASGTTASTTPTTATTPGTTTAGVAGGSAGDGQSAMATQMILPQIARMVGTAYADDLITIIDTAMSVLQRSAPMAYREKVMQLRGQTAGKQREKAADIITRTKKKKKGAPAAASVDPASVPRPGIDPSRTVTGGGGEAPPATGTTGTSESRKVFGGKYIKESADAKIAREFEKFVMAME